MNLIFALTIVLLTSTICSAGKVGMPDAQLQVWQRMKTENHAVYQRLLTESRGYEDYGMRDGLLYVITGDNAYARKAWAQEKWRKNKTLVDGSTTNRDETRHQLPTMSLLYAWIYDGLDETGQAEFDTTMEKWVNYVLKNTRTSDSDELVGHYFGVAVYALAIKDRNLARSNELIGKIGGFDATGTGYDTWRNALKRFGLLGKGGQWIESSNYNINTSRYFVFGITAVNDALEVNKFPEFDLNEYAEGQIAEVTPDFRDSYQWGDNQDLHHLSKFARVPLWSSLCGITKNKKICYGLDRILQNEMYQGIWYAYYDPYTARETVDDMTHHASGMGLGFFKKDNSLFAVHTKPRTGADHEYDDFFDFGLYENGKWTITHPLGYYSNLYKTGTNHNTTKIWGMFPTIWQKSKKTIEAQWGDDWYYQAGTVSGQTVQSSAPQPTIVVQEGSWQLVYLHKEAIVIFQRINVKDPKSLSDFSKYRAELQALYTPYHQFRQHLPDTMTVQNGDYVWTNNGRTMRLKAYFAHDYTYGKFSACCGTPTAENKNVLTLKAKNTQEWMTLLTVIDLTNVASINRISEGEVQVNTTRIKFNADKSTPLSFEINRNASVPEPTPEPEPEPTPIPTPEPTPCPEPPPCPACPDPVICPEPIVCPTLDINIKVNDQSYECRSVPNG